MTIVPLLLYNLREKNFRKLPGFDIPTYIAFTLVTLPWFNTAQYVWHTTFQVHVYIGKKVIVPGKLISKFV